MDRELEEEIEIDKRRIVYLCQRILAKDIDLILAIKEIDELNFLTANVFGEHIINEEWVMFVITLIDHLAQIRKKKESIEILKFYEQSIIEFAEETIELLGIADTDQLYNQLTLALKKTNFKECIHLVKMLITSEDKTCIGKLLTYFDDNSDPEKTEILIAIAKKIEHYPIEILQNLSSLIPEVKDWAYYLLFNMLKNKKTFLIFWENRSLVKDQDLLFLLKLISENDAKHISEMKSINELVKNLKS